MVTIPSQLPPVVTAPRSGTLQTLALQSGQTVDAKIIGTAANGATQVEIRGQVVNLALPVPVKPGDTIQLQVQGVGQQMKLALQLVTAPNLPASPAPAAPPPDADIPLQTTPAAQTQVTSQAPAAAQPPVTTPNAPAPPQAAPPPVPSATAAQTPQTPLPAAAPAATVQVASTAPLPTAQGMAPLYPQAPGTPNPFAVAAAATAVTQPAPASTTSPGNVRPVLGVAPAGGSTSNPLSGNNTPPATTPQAALAQMVHTAVPRQAPVTDLTAALSSIAGKVVLPEPVARAAQQVLAGRVAIDSPRFDGNALQAAVRGSGVFQEAALAQGQTPLPSADMKTALLTLRSTLVNWLGQQAPMAGVAQVPPPLKGITPRARAHEAPPLDPDAAPEEIGKQLLERTDSALARTRLHQHASLPDTVGRTADWSMELPVLIGQHQTTMQFQIHRDETNDSESVTERGWQMRFAINLPNMGEVGAQVSLRAGTTGVMLWASEPEASAALDGEVAVLREALAAVGLKPGAVIVRNSEPHDPTPAPSGHFVDART